MAGAAAVTRRAIASLALPALAMAPPSLRAEPAPTAAVFQDWTLACRAEPPPGCRLATLAETVGGSPAMLAIDWVRSDAAPSLAVHGLGAGAAGPWRLATEAWEAELAGAAADEGVLALAPPLAVETVLEALRAGLDLEVAAIAADGTAAPRVRFSLRGVTAGLEAAAAERQRLSLTDQAALQAAFGPEEADLLAGIAGTPAAAADDPGAAPADWTRHLGEVRPLIERCVALAPLPPDRIRAVTAAGFGGLSVLMHSPGAPVADAPAPGAGGGPRGAAADARDLLCYVDPDTAQVTLIRPATAADLPPPGTPTLVLPGLPPPDRCQDLEILTDPRGTVLGHLAPAGC